VRTWFLSSFFGNYLSGFLGSFWERMPREAFFLMLAGLGLCGAIAIRLLGGPLERVVAGHDGTASQEGN
jgi:POT family proton-dependent oligopeptide transporter